MIRVAGSNKKNRLKNRLNLDSAEKKSVLSTNRIEIARISSPNVAVSRGLFRRPENINLAESSRDRGSFPPT